MRSRVEIGVAGRARHAVPREARIVLARSSVFSCARNNVGRAMSEPTSPLMQQYHAIKTRYPHALLLFRLGDFYELFYEDAILASRELQITLTSRNREKGQPIPMCGVPYHAADGYIARLIRGGFKIAICDQ